jgi:hypothetical protein
VTWLGVIHFERYPGTWIKNENVVLEVAPEWWHTLLQTAAELGHYTDPHVKTRPGTWLTLYRALDRVVREHSREDY